MTGTLIFLTACALFCLMVIRIHKSNDPLADFKAPRYKEIKLHYKHIGSAQFEHCIYRFTLKFAHHENNVILRDQTSLLPCFYVYYSIPMACIKKSKQPEWDYLLTPSGTSKKAIRCRIAAFVMQA
jgi:hypothetical protein